MILIGFAVEEQPFVFCPDKELLEELVRAIYAPPYPDEGNQVMAEQFAAQALEGILPDGSYSVSFNEYRGYGPCQIEIKRHNDGWMVTATTAPGLITPTFGLTHEIVSLMTYTQGIHAQLRLAPDDNLYGLSSALNYLLQAAGMDVSGAPDWLDGLKKGEVVFESGIDRAVALLAKTGHEHVLQLHVKRDTSGIDTGRYHSNEDGGGLNFQKFKMVLADL